MKLKGRIQLVDIIRGFALFGILVLHFIEHFDLLKYPENTSGFLASSDMVIHDVLFFVFAGKAYSVFAILFGFSFYIQMNNYKLKEINFSSRFIWRLIVLFAIGYIHSLFYCGDILTVFGLMGMVLVACYRLTNRMLIIFSTLLLINIPMVYQVVLSYLEPKYVFSQYWGDVWNRAFDTFAEGTFLDVIKFNSVSGHYAKALYTFNSSRYLQMPGLFLIGLLIGRSKYFENTLKYNSVTMKILIGSIIAFVCCEFLKGYNLLYTFTETQKSLTVLILQYFSNMFLTSLLISTLVIGYNKTKNLVSYEWISNYGRMSLTNYVSQAMFGVILFYNYGFAMYKELGVTLSFACGLIFFTLQNIFCSYWLKTHRYGPLEWLWRKITLIKFKVSDRQEGHETKIAEDVV